jgi:hypothetical protein
VSTDNNALATAYQPNNVGATGWDPIANPVIWDFVLVGAARTPGIAVVHEFKRRHEFDVKKSKGVYGATITFVGRPPATGRVELKLWQSQHFADLQSFIPNLKYDPTKSTVQAVDVYHPSLDLIEIRSVVCESIGNIIHAGQKLYTVELELLEYFPPPAISAVSTPTRSIADGEVLGRDGTPPDPIGDANDKEIAQLLAAAQQP